MQALCLAIKVHMGWINCAVVRCGFKWPEIARLERLDLDPDGDRELLEPWHVAAGWQGLERVAPAPDPAAVVARGLALQQTALERALERLREALAADGGDLQQGVVLKGRGLLLGLEDGLSSHSHVHVAEGESVRSASRAALTALGIPWVDQDEKSIPNAAAARLGVPDADVWMKEHRPAGLRKFSKEERLVALGAWLHA